MATASWTKDTDVNRPVIEHLLRENPCRFQFFQAVRLLERLGRDRQPVGGFVHPDREAVRFSVHNALAFPPSQIHAIDWTQEGMPRMVVNFMGLTGPLGVLPYCYTELIVERLRARDHTLQAFFDIFNHRMISFFYQAWEKYRFPVAYERDQNDRLTRHVMALVGIGTQGLQGRQELSDEALLFYAGLLSLQPHSATALGQILEGYFGVGVEIEQFAGAWYSLEASNQCSFEEGNEYSEQLGLGAIVGDEIWDQQSRVRIKLGPLSEKQYLDFLPHGKAHAPLRAWTTFFSGGQLEFEIQLILKRGEVPRCELGNEEPGGPQLGWLTWMKSVPGEFDRHPGDTILLLN